MPVAGTSQVGRFEVEFTAAKLPFIAAASKLRLMAVIPRGSPALAAHQREVIDAIVVGRSFTPVFSARSVSTTQIDND